MKKIKKLLCMMLAVLLLALASTVVVTAEEPTQPDMEELHRLFDNYLENLGEEITEFNNSSVSFILFSGECKIFQGTLWPVATMPASERIGNYVFGVPNRYRPYAVGLYAEYNGKILTLKEAYESKNLDLEQIVEYTSGHYQVLSPGDTNMDGNVMLEDVLDVQKVISKFTKVEAYDFAYNLYDYDGNGEINVKDVLDMQKKIAKITE